MRVQTLPTPACERLAAVLELSWNCGFHPVATSERAGHLLRLRHFPKRKEGLERLAVGTSLRRRWVSGAPLLVPSEARICPRPGRPLPSTHSAPSQCCSDAAKRDARLRRSASQTQSGVLCRHASDGWCPIGTPPCACPLKAGDSSREAVLRAACISTMLLGYIPRQRRGREGLLCHGRWSPRVSSPGSMAFINRRGPDVRPLPSRPFARAAGWVETWAPDALHPPCWPCPNSRGRRSVRGSESILTSDVRLCLIRSVHRAALRGDHQVSDPPA